MKRLPSSRSPLTWVVVAAILSLLLGSIVPPLYINHSRPLPVDQDFSVESAPATGPVLDVDAYSQRAVPETNRAEEGCGADSSKLHCYITESDITVTRQMRSQSTDFPGAEKKSVAATSSDVSFQVSGRTLLETSEEAFLNRESAYPMPGENNSQHVDGALFASGFEQDAFERDGLNYFFPSATEQRSYAYFDSLTQRADPIDYRTKETLESIPTYVYHQDIAPTSLPEALNGAGPATLRGPARDFYSPDSLARYSLGAADSVVLEPYYTVSREVWVEPTTGTVLNADEKLSIFYATDAKQAKDMAAAQDTAQRSLLSVDMTFSDDSRAQRHSTVAPLITTIKVLSLLGWAGKALGMVLLGVAAFIFVRHHRARG
ncbi:DUF3068 domain-containing protein [Corynebacterium flavescens]|uniref:DUF3068 domain-containing protein n=1 Tax=Corynebacterium flavescens TaxID=28028 RepID=UPI003FD5EB64